MAGQTDGGRHGRATARRSIRAAADDIDVIETSGDVAVGVDEAACLETAFKLQAEVCDGVDSGGAAGHTAVAGRVLRGARRKTWRSYSLAGVVDSGGGGSRGGRGRDARGRGSRGGRGGQKARRATSTSTSEGT
ncbi:hypothetical protein GN958_ATG00382 [Phytophthora infestans]|uniref:Uncharacterized protein n=1 Tax=Phytophthora infestans TaxID=4787 RepID=A0A8S9VCH6_PHYIN|nr:hypothetical protein GN958_ATG00382 [Phytophthora infestans]